MVKAWKGMHYFPFLQRCVRTFEFSEGMAICQRSRNELTFLTMPNRWNRTEVTVPLSKTVSGYQLPEQKRGQERCRMPLHEQHNIQLVKYTLCGKLQIYLTPRKVQNTREESIREFRFYASSTQPENSVPYQKKTCMSQMNLVQINKRYILLINCNIRVSSTVRSIKWLLPFIFAD